MVFTQALFEADARTATACAYKKQKASGGRLWVTRENVFYGADRRRILKAKAANPAALRARLDGSGTGLTVMLS